MARLPLQASSPAANAALAGATIAARGLNAPANSDYRNVSGNYDQYTPIMTQLMKSLLTKYQGLSGQNFYQKELNLGNEAINRAQSSVQSNLALSPNEQGQIRNARVQAIEDPLQMSIAQRKDWEQKVQNFPDMINAISDFASKMGENSGDKIISQTFKEDDQGNVTWVGITKDHNVITQDIGKIGAPASKRSFTENVGGTLKRFVEDNQGNIINEQVLGESSTGKKKTATYRSLLTVSQNLKKSDYSKEEAREEIMAYLSNKSIEASQVDIENALNEAYKPSLLQRTYEKIIKK